MTKTGFIGIPDNAPELPGEDTMVVHGAMTRLDNERLADEPSGLAKATASLLAYIDRQSWSDEVLSMLMSDCRAALAKGKQP